MRRIIFLSLSIIFSTPFASAGEIILSQGFDDGGRTFVGEEQKAVIDAVDKIKSTCAVRGVPVSGVNIHFLQCNWDRSGESRVCKALVSASCQDGVAGNNNIAISETLTSNDSGDVELAELKLSLKVKQKAQETCLSLNGRVVSSLEAASCSGQNDIDDLTCVAGALVSCAY